MGRRGPWRLRSFLPTAQPAPGMGRGLSTFQGLKNSRGKGGHTPPAAPKLGPAASLASAQAQEEAHEQAASVWHCKAILVNPRHPAGAAR